jgi:hypothetical protein
MILTQSTIAGVGLFYISIILSGFWLSRSARPYRVLVLSIHKLVSLAAVAFLIVTALHMNQAAKPGAIDLLAGAIAGLFILSAVVSGGMLSTGKPMPAAVLTMHRTTPLLTGLSTAVALYLLLGQRS